MSTTNKNLIKFHLKNKMIIKEGSMEYVKQIKKKIQVVNKVHD